MRKAYVRYFAALLLFGMNGLLVSAINLPSCEIVFLRTLLGSGVLLCLVAALKPAKLSCHDGLFVVGSGVAMGASWTVQYEAFQLIGVGVSSLVYCLGPVLIVALAPRLLGERPSAVHMAGLGVVLLGVVFINVQALGLGLRLLASCALWPPWLPTWRWCCLSSGRRTPVACAALRCRCLPPVRSPWRRASSCKLLVLSSWLFLLCRT